MVNEGSNGIATVLKKEEVLDGLYSLVAGTMLEAHLMLAPVRSGGEDWLEE